MAEYFLWESLKGTDNLKDFGTDASIIHRILREQDLRLRIGLSWLGHEPMESSCERRNMPVRVKQKIGDFLAT
jgi:hypothetical protein